MTRESRGGRGRGSAPAYVGPQHQAKDTRNQKNTVRCHSAVQRSKQGGACAKSKIQSKLEKTILHSSHFVTPDMAASVVPVSRAIARASCQTVYGISHEPTRSPY